MIEKKLRVCPTLDRFYETAATLFVERAKESIRRHKSFNVSLCGGTTPGALYEKLATAEWRNKVDWAHVKFFWGDERHVAPDDEKSSQRLARNTLLDKVPVLPENIFPIPFLNSADEAAKAYQETLLSRFGGLPSFDLSLLGVGADGHTASLFPGVAAVNETKKWTASSQSPDGVARVTLTFPVFNNARHIMILVKGSDKAQIVREIWHDRAPYPAQKIQPTDGEVLWLLDAEAASALA